MPAAVSRRSESGWVPMENGVRPTVTSRVDSSAFHEVNTKTGATVGPALPARLTRYLENVAEGKRSDGTWFVSRLAVYPAASTQGARCR